VKQSARNKKKPKSLEELLNILQLRGLENRRNLDIQKYLRSMDYYRFIGYARYWQADPLHGAKTFMHNADVSDIREIINLDRQLRCMILEGIQVFEPALRAAIIREFTHVFGAYGYLELDTYISNKKNTQKRQELAEYLVNSINSDINKSKEPCIWNFKRANAKVPIWATLEVITLGTLSRMFSLCKDYECRTKIAESFEINRNNKRFSRTLRVITYLRNLSSHQSRLWNRYIKIPSKLPDEIIEKYANVTENSVMESIIPLIEIVDKINDDNSYSIRMLKLISSNKTFMDGICNPQKDKVRW
jgi:abortive infection bacteriophage resistance protein